MRIAYEMAVLCGFWCDFGLVNKTNSLCMLQIYVYGFHFFCINVGLCLLAREAWQILLAMGTLYSDKYDVLRCVSN